MPNMSKSPRRGSSSGVDVPLILFWAAVIIVAIMLSGSSCSVPAGAGSENQEECEWELEKRSVSHSLTDVSLTIRGTQLVSASVPKPPAPIKAPAPVRAPSIPTVKPVKPPVNMPKVNPTGKPVKMPTVKPPKPASAPPGKVWEYDCD